MSPVAGLIRQRRCEVNFDSLSEGLSAWSATSLSLHDDRTRHPKVPSDRGLFTEWRIAAGSPSNAKAYKI
jgi:hypothetical protein